MVLPSNLFYSIYFYILFFTQLDESWFTSYPCTERCTCKANNTIKCTSWECGVQEECSIQDGVLGCHSNGKSCLKTVLSVSSIIRSFFSF